MLFLPGYPYYAERTKRRNVGRLKQCHGGRAAGYDKSQYSALREFKRMLFSRDRILTTHVGSLPRNEKLSNLLLRQEAGETFDAKEMAAEMDAAVSHVVGKQVSAGIDIGNDGEQQRVGFQTYVPQRMSGFGGVSKRRRGREFEEFPELVSYLTRRFPNVSRQQNAPEAQGELHYHDTT